MGQWAATRCTNPVGCVALTRRWQRAYDRSRSPSSALPRVAEEREVHMRKLLLAAGSAMLAATLLSVLVMVGSSDARSSRAAVTRADSSLPSNVPYSLPVMIPADKSSPTVSAQAPYTPAVLSLIAQLEPEANADRGAARKRDACCFTAARTAAATTSARRGSDRDEPVDHADVLDRRAGRQHVLGPERREDDRPDDADGPGVVV